jgi:hypothetical protein
MDFVRKLDGRLEEEAEADDQRNEQEVTVEKRIWTQGGT